jgi:hypothetical protein
MGLSNQGRQLDGVFDAVEWGDIIDITKVIWDEVRAHPSEASCFCPTLEVLARLRELGYEVKPE